MDPPEGIEPMSEEEMTLIIFGMEYIEEHPEEFPNVELTHF